MNRISLIQKYLKEGETLLLFAEKAKKRNLCSDTDLKFRQDSHFFYVTGLDESDAILVLQKNNSYSFSLPKDKLAETWDGVRLGKDFYKKKLNLTESFELSDFPKQFIEIIKNQGKLYYFYGQDLERDKEVLSYISSLMEQRKYSRFQDYLPYKMEIPCFLNEMRNIKTEAEITKIKEAVLITEKAFEKVIPCIKPNMYEYEVEALLYLEYRKSGAWGEAYPQIIAGGNNATVLHYTDNNCILEDGSLVLIDSGAEKDYYCADVTRTLPIGKKFSDEQKLIYEIVLNAEKKVIEECKQGVEYDYLHQLTARYLSEGLLELNLLEGSLEEVLEKKTYHKFFMHGTGHYLGIDVHDVGFYFDKNQKSFLLKENQILTIEPGLYFNKYDETIPEKFRGIGVRIEDDILIKKDTFVNLTQNIPKEIDDIYQINK